MRRLRQALALAAAVMVATPTFADDWPSRPVRMVNTFAAGGTADVLTRMVADHLLSVFGQQFYVETRAGAGGASAEAAGGVSVGTFDAGWAGVLRRMSPMGSWTGRASRGPPCPTRCRRTRCATAP